MSPRQRFEFLAQQVCKVRLWKDNNGRLFSELKVLVQVFMDKIAKLCDKRYEELSAHPMGADMLAWPIPIAAALAAPSSTRRAAGQYLRVGWEMSISCTNQNLDTDSEVSVKRLQTLVWEALVDSKSELCRQDNPKVGAIRVSAEDQQEAQMEEQDACLLTQLDEEVFLSQVYRRARLLNRPFQRAVIETIRCKANQLPSEQPILLPAANSEGVGPPSRLVPGHRPSRLSVQSSEWADTTASTLQKNLSGATLHSLSSTETGVCTVHWRSVQSATCCDVQNFEKTESSAEWWAEVHPAPIKTTARMREKLAKYAPPDPRGTWPLSANILDPVRTSIVCSGGPAQILEVANWIVAGSGATASGQTSLKSCAQLTVIRTKNRFSQPRDQVPDGYRDIKLFVAFRGGCGLGIIGEIQIHDSTLHDLKLQMHKLYKVKRAKSADLIT